MIRGSVDIITPNEVRGWAYGPGHTEPVLVQAVLNHEILGEAQANMHRADLAAAGLGDGNSGYIIKTYRPIDPLYFPFITVKVDGGDAELPRAPMLGFGEFFNALYAAQPAAGRHRSHLGGLWTDRTDAAALLRGKLAVGQVPEDAAAPIRRLIEDGFFTLPLHSAPDEPPEAVLENPALRAVLQAVLEDHPLFLKPAPVREDENFGQPSTRNASPSPAECLEILIAPADGAVLEVVRDSHKLPEFSLSGGSRWAHGSVTAVGAQQFLDRYELEAGTVAVLGAGTVFRAKNEKDKIVARTISVPARGRNTSSDGLSNRTKIDINTETLFAVAE